jgi:GR25 family glycosyltransferase involved in LPS biosynthesis
MTSTISKCIVINLDHRQDRYQSLLQRLPIPFYPLERFSAVNGHQLKSTRALEQFFNPNDYNYRRGMIGCALSHITLWMEIFHSKSNDPVLILEDDVEFVPDCKEKIDYALQNAPEDWDILFLGYLPWQPIESAHTKSHVQFEKWGFLESVQRSKGGAHGYVVRPRSLHQLFTFLQLSGMTNAIDTMLLRACDHMNIYHCKYPIINQLHMGDVQKQLQDTDIQRDFLSLKRPLMVRLNEELNYYSKHNIPVLIVSNATTYNPSDFEERVVFCSEGNCSHPPLKNTLTYWMENISIHIPDKLIQKHPFLMNIGLVLDGRWSTSQMLV